MVFSNLFSTFAFLPVTLILYYSLVKPLGNIVLLTVSLFFYAQGEPVYVLLMCGSIMINYFIGTLLGRDNAIKRKRKLFLIMGLVFNLGTLSYFKYSGLMISTIASVCGWNFNAQIPTLPLGISFYTFHALSYMIDLYRGKIKQQKSPILFAFYITMFPQLVAGPIVKYAEIESQLAKRNITFEKSHSGMRRFLCSLAKKVLLANNIGLIWSQVKAMHSTEISVILAWMGIIAFTLQIYYYRGNVN